MVDDVQQALRFFNTYRASEHQRERDQERLLPATYGQLRYQNLPDDYQSDGSPTSKNDAKKSAKKDPK